MPFPIVFTFWMVISALLVGVAYWLAMYWLEESASDPETAGWDRGYSSDFRYMVSESQRHSPCPHCKGIRCWDWRFNGKTCEKSPTRAEFSSVLMGQHGQYTVKPAVAGWWPLPKTVFGKVRRDLWAQVANHCQISLAKPARALP